MMLKKIGSKIHRQNKFFKKSCFLSYIKNLGKRKYEMKYKTTNNANRKFNHISHCSKNVVANNVNLNNFIFIFKTKLQKYHLMLQFLEVAIIANKLEFLILFTILMNIDQIKFFYCKHGSIVQKL
jgi:hypothetical protein